MTGEIFISYRRSDEAHARRLHDLLKAEGVDAWYDARVGAGQDWRHATAKALEQSSIFVLLFSKAASESDDIAKELAAATYSKKLIVPVRIENIEPTGAFLYELASRNWINAYENTDARLADLAKNLAEVVKQGVSGDAVVQFQRTTSNARPGRKPLIVGAAVVAVALAGAAAFALFSGDPKPAPGRIAFFGVDAPAGDPAAASVAAATSSGILTTFAALQRDVAASADTAGVASSDRLALARSLRAAYAISGSATRSGEQVAVTVVVEDVASRSTLWSDTFEGPGSAAAPIASRTAALLNDKLVCVINARASLRRDDMRIVSRFPRACESIRTAAPDTMERWRELTVLAPESAWVLGGAAFVAFNAIPDASPASADDYTRLAEDSLRRGEELDPNSPEVLRAKVASVRFHGGSLLEIEEAFLEALRRAPRGANLLGGYGAYLIGLGRQQDSVSYGREAMALDPLSAPKLLGIGESYAHAGLPAEAASLFARAHAQFPGPAEWQLRVVESLFKGVGDVEDVLRDPAETVSAQTRACLTDIVRLIQQARQPAKTEAIRRAGACVQAGVLEPRRGYEIQAFLGGYETIFELGTMDPGHFFSDATNPFRSFLFDPDLAPMRLDPRFAPMMERAGLVTYWRESGKPPDFCRTEKAPVCALIAAK